jgi:hypothetical protein
MGLSSNIHFKSRFPGKNDHMASFTFSLPGFKTAIVLFLTTLIVITLQPRPAFAVACHCFKERTFKSSHPASADPYILATTRNSLIAATSGIDKRTVVRQRMRGATETDLWLSAYLSTLNDYTAQQLLNARDEAASWAGALDHLNLDTEVLGKAFNDARTEDDPDSMARALAEPVIGRAFGVRDPDLAKLRENGANIAETALSLYLAAGADRTSTDIFSSVRNGTQTWGSQLHTQGIKVDTIGDLIAEKVKKKL